MLLYLLKCQKLKLRKLKGLSVWDINSILSSKSSKCYMYVLLLCISCCKMSFMWPELENDYQNTFLCVHVNDWKRKNSLLFEQTKYAKHYHLQPLKDPDWFWQSLKNNLNKETFTKKFAENKMHIQFKKRQKKWCFCIAGPTMFGSYVCVLY